MALALPLLLGAMPVLVVVVAGRATSIIAVQKITVHAERVRGGTRRPILLAF